MNKAERMLRICADTFKMPGWNDALSVTARRVEDQLSKNALPDDMLSDVAGGRPETDPAFPFGKP